jgi:hypothetical protein
MTNGIKGAAVAAVLAAGGLVSNAFGLASLPFIEEFASGNANWLNEPGASATWMPTGGADGGGYISYTPPAFTSNSSGAFSAPPFQLMFRANNSTSSSGGAFVGNWLSGGVASLNLAVRHNYETSLNFYARLAASTPPGAAASLAYDGAFAIAPNAWTSVSIPIVNSNPPFLSYGSGSFNGIFSNILNMQFGLYLPASTAFTALQMDIDNVSIVPEPGTVGLVVIGLAGLGLLRRRQVTSSHK